MRLSTSMCVHEPVCITV